MYDKIHYKLKKKKERKQNASVLLIGINLESILVSSIPWWLRSKESTSNAGDTRDMSLIPRLETSLGEGNGNPLQYSYLENSMDKWAWL